jgi:hypothetical protein
VIFFPGLHQPSDAQHFPCAFISVNRLRRRKGLFRAQRWIMDSGAFTELSLYGRYRYPAAEYSREIRRWRWVGELLGAVSQDYMCEPMMLARTGLTIRDHQRMTIVRYDELLEAEPGVTIIPVLQGYAPSDYVEHVRQYGFRLGEGAWVGVGSICKRNGDPAAVLAVLRAIKAERPDLLLHGFGLKKTALRHPEIVELLHTADSMSWSYAARRRGGGQNDWRKARAFAAAIEGVAPMPDESPLQLVLL